MTRYTVYILIAKLLIHHILFLRFWFSFCNFDSCSNKAFQTFKTKNLAFFVGEFTNPSKEETICQKPLNNNQINYEQLYSNAQVKISKGWCNIATVYVNAS